MKGSKVLLEVGRVCSRLAGFANGGSRSLLTADTRYLREPLSKKGLYFRFPYPEKRTRAQKLGTRRVPRATSFSEKRTPASENRTLPILAARTRDGVWGPRVVARRARVRENTFCVANVSPLVYSSLCIPALSSFNFPRTATSAFYTNAP